MILTLNLNASLDKIYTVDELTYGGIVRAKTVQNTAGGKGLHVANICKELNEAYLATGFLGGKTGEYLRDKLTQNQINHDFVPIKNETRACINIATSDGNQTEILEPGPAISQEETNLFLAKYTQLLTHADIVVASGSLPNNLPLDFYGTLTQLATKHHKKFLLDTSGQTLKESLKYKPFFIKPNKDEIEQLTGIKIDSLNTAISQVQEFQKLGIIMPVISLGKNGSIIGYQSQIYHAIPPQYKAINAVGSGDAFVAGIAIGLKRNYPIIDIIKLGSACGTANVLEAESGFVSKDNVEKIFNLVKVKQIL